MQSLLKNDGKLYLKFIRNILPSGELHRGTLYSVHFQPNEMGGYNECLMPISDAYEIPYGSGYPLPLIYPAGVVRINGFARLTLGMGTRRSALHLIDIQAREVFLPMLREALLAGDEIRIEVV